MLMQSVQKSTKAGSGGGQALARTPDRHTIPESVPKFFATGVSSATDFYHIAMPGTREDFRATLDFRCGRGIFPGMVRQLMLRQSPLKLP